MTIRSASTGEPGRFEVPAELTMHTTSGDAGVISARNVWVYPEP